MLLTLGRVAVALASIALAVLALRSALRTIVVPGAYLAVDGDWGPETEM
jgi:hypothetical protein